ncbi:hypothetical protein E15042_1843 [Escherichia coli]|nr:hypothetical protein E15042_1843 [Escherichia coli]
MPNKKRNPLIEKQIECLVNQLRQSGLLKTHSELRLTESAFDDKLNNVLYNGIMRCTGNSGHYHLFFF